MPANCVNMSGAPSRETSTIEDFNGSNNMCLELALEGERLCKVGDCRAGVAFFQAAIQAGTDDLRTLSAIYSQMGNAYFYLGDYEKAMQYHRHDLTLARTIGDKSGEAKASGNLGNTLKVMGRFEEAISCCKHHLLLARELEDQVGEGRALYNLGNVYHAKGKHSIRSDTNDEKKHEERAPLLEAVAYYEDNLQLMQSIGDVAAQGRACGNLGNTFYLLGDFQQAVRYHGERSSIARQFGDKAAERRAHNNLGNSYIFLGKFEDAKHHYERTLELAQELNDCIVEAQACYSLGNTSTLLKDYNAAVDYHLRHLYIAQTLSDRIGEGRAFWSLTNAYASLDNYEKSLEFAKKHLYVSTEIGDTMGELTAKANISEMDKLIEDANNACPSQVTHTSETDATTTLRKDSSCQSSIRIRRESMGHLNLIQMTPTAKQIGRIVPLTGKTRNDEEALFDAISDLQSNRMDDQRCAVAPCKRTDNINEFNPSRNQNEEPDDLISMLAGLQSKRMDEQRAELPKVADVQKQNQDAVNLTLSTVPDDEFLEDLFIYQGGRMDDQRSVLTEKPSIQPDDKVTLETGSTKASTVPEEDFFSLIMKLQSERMDNQRATFKVSGKLSLF